MKIADMKLRGIIMTPAFTPDNNGGVICNWVDGDEVWCQLTAKAEYKQILLRHNANIKPGYRLKIDDVIYEILNISDYGEIQMLKCK